MKLFARTITILTSIALLTGCYSEDNWLEDNWEKTGNHYPNVSDVSLLNAQESYTEEDELSFDLRFWSEEDIESITFLHQYAGNDQEVVSMYGYEEAGFSEASNTDSLIIDYTIPQGSSGSTIHFEFVVTGTNGLSTSNNDATDASIHDISVDVD